MGQPFFDSATQKWRCPDCSAVEPIGRLTVSSPLDRLEEINRLSDQFVQRHGACEALKTVGALA